VSVAVDQAGEQRRVAKVEDPSASGRFGLHLCRCADSGDPITLNEYRCGREECPGPRIEKSARLYQRDKSGDWAMSGPESKRARLSPAKSVNILRM
jgi:hypothetical protein